LRDELRELRVREKVSEGEEKKKMKKKIPT
jgi:hypothetical protein